MKLGQNAKRRALAGALVSRKHDNYSQVNAERKSITL